MMSSRLDCSPPFFRQLWARLVGGIASLSIVVILLGAGMWSAAHAADDVLYQELGSQPGVERIVQGLTRLYQTDPRIKADFDNINPDWLARRLSDFICQTAGGPCIYKGRDMVSAHKGLDVNTAKFNAVVEDLQSAMEQAGVPFQTQNRLLARLAPTHREIVTR